MKQSEIVRALAQLASEGVYNVKPEGAQKMNQVFAAVAGLINELEAKEAEEETENENDSV